MVKLRDLVTTQPFSHLFHFVNFQHPMAERETSCHIDLLPSKEIFSLAKAELDAFHDGLDNLLCDLIYAPKKKNDHLQHHLRKANFRNSFLNGRYFFTNISNSQHRQLHQL
jgi:hypothetical protein